MTLREALIKKRWSVQDLAFAYDCSTAYLYAMLRSNKVGKKGLKRLSAALKENITGV